ncbi:hypothetical protein DLD77_05100 [Chitinophaga alhagiae]|uniref:Uncharacterized protein n=1 Tax=Chitinophaga alhagiae TaxID=2203219 RepID=A0ABM6WDP9_9BACT|nr:hypothetical protein [Chitinophaga alhagiae]AWO02232.1 hypothetical protein DLD77_05100 [Chitinophaga alhagiae]
MVEVFKTNVNSACYAHILIYRIRQRFTEYIVNFDLEDCDRILRVKSTTGTIHPLPLIAFLQQHGCTAEVLPDECPVPHVMQAAGFVGALHG